MNDRIQNHELNQLLKQLNLPENLSYRQQQEIALYAAYKLQEQKKKAEKIVFNPSEAETSGQTSQPVKSDANMSHFKYKISNSKKK